MKKLCSGSKTCIRFSFLYRFIDFPAPLLLRQSRRQQPADTIPLLSPICYSQGLGVEKNDEEALQWFQKAAEAGHPAGKMNLAISYYEGEGVEQECQEVNHLLDKSFKKLKIVIVQFIFSVS